MESGQSTRTRIVETAWRLFMRHTYSKTSLAEIARELGMSKRTIYEHVPDKEALLRLGVQAALDRADAQVDELVAAEPDPRRRFRAFVAWTASHSLEYSEAVLYDMRRSSPQVWADMEERRRVMIHRHLAAVVAGAPHMPAGVGAEDLATALAMAVEGVLGHVSPGAAGDSDRRYLDLFLRVIEAGLFGPEE